MLLTYKISNIVFFNCLFSGEIIDFQYVNIENIFGSYILFVFL